MRTVDGSNNVIGGSLECLTSLSKRHVIAFGGDNNRLPPDGEFVQQRDGRCVVDIVDENAGSLAANGHGVTEKEEHK